jgi:uncharacterized membrane protein
MKTRFFLFGSLAIMSAMIIFALLNQPTLYSHALFLLSGLFWVLSDIPTQYRVKRLTASLDPSDGTLPAELTRLLMLRWWISLAGVAPLVVVFILMVYKPEIPALASLFR